MYAEFQLIILSIGWDIEMGPKEQAIFQPSA